MLTCETAEGGPEESNDVCVIASRKAAAKNGRESMASSALVTAAREAAIAGEGLDQAKGTDAR